MSYSATWRLPVHEIERSTVEAALKIILAAHGAKLGAAIDEDLEEFADDFEEYPLGDETYEFSIGLLGRELSEHGDSPSEEPDDDGRYWGLIAVCAGDEEDEPAYVTIDSNDAQNRSCWMALGNIAGELSVELGGPDEPEPS